MKNSENNIVVGIPRALYYERYHILWKSFWEALDVSVMVSPETNREIIENGSKLTIDEACLSLKIFIGHVEKLIGTCDYVMIPRICIFGNKRDMCTRFYGLEKCRKKLNFKNRE